MQRYQPSTQAMIEFQKLIQRLESYMPLVLRRTGRFWELWASGDDFGMTEAERDRLAEESDDMFHQSYRVGHLVITPQGAIKSLEFGRSYGQHHTYDEYAGMPVLAQLMKFLHTHSSDGYILDIYVDLRPRGSMIEVDVKAIEDDTWQDEHEVTHVETHTRLLAEFTYDPANNLLLHRTK